jgi:hypothetical protein
MTEASSAFNFRGTLEQLTSAFESLSSMHSKGISINLWPLIQRRSDGETMQASFVPSYGFWADDPVLDDWLIPGSKAPSKELKYAPIVGRRFPRRITTRFPPEPKDGRPSPLEVWTPSKAMQDPLVPGAPLVSGGIGSFGLLSSSIVSVATLEPPLVKHRRSLRSHLPNREEGRTRVGRNDE